MSMNTGLVASMVALSLNELENTDGDHTQHSNNNSPPKLNTEHKNLIVNITIFAASCVKTQNAPRNLSMSSLTCG